MKEKFTILILVFLFFISTTGLPVFSHYCTGLGKSVNSDCNFCLTDEEISSSCCSDEVVEINEMNKIRKTDCCVVAFDYKKIEDNFSQPITFKLIFANNVNELLVDEAINHENVKIQSNLNTCNLPPPKYGKELLNTIHQLKIDLPVC